MIDSVVFQRLGHRADGFSGAALMSPRADRWRIRSRAAAPVPTPALLRTAFEQELDLPVDAQPC